MFGRKKKVLAAAGSIAPPFRLTGLDGSARSLQDILAGGPVLLAFFKVSCPVCQLTAPYLERLAANGGLQVIGISQDEAGVTRSFLQRFGVTLPILLDLAAEDYPASNAYGIASVPSLFLIEPDAIVSRCFSGFSKRDFEEIGARAGVLAFRPDDQVPEWKAG